MIPKYLTRAAVCGWVIALALFLPAQGLVARGTSRLRWGYRAPAGNPFVNLWGVASPWAAINGWGIPHHSLDAPRLGPGYGNWTFDDGSRAPPFDRSVEFPGASSNPTPLMPPAARPVPAGPYRTEKRFEPPYYHNYDSYWHHGYWGGGLWGWARWGGPLGIAGFTRWSSGPVYYTSGYGVYRNPFVAGQKVPLVALLDYAKPIENIADDEEPRPRPTVSDPAASLGDASDESPEEIREYLVKSPEVKAGLKSFDAAGDAFKNKNYDLALEKTDEALGQLPYDAAIHEFRGLILFARKDYQQAAATIYAVLAVSPGWDWTTLSSRYSDQKEFANALRELESWQKQNPESAAAAFLCGYHYATCRHFEAAVKQFQTAAKLLADDLLIPRLARLIARAEEKSPPASPPAPAPTPAPAPAADQAPAQNVQPITNAKLIGGWKARRDPTTIRLTLRTDQQFVWTATTADKTRRIAGRYALEGNLLILAGGSGTLVGFVQPRKPAGFNFTLVDDDPGDTGLDFTSE